MTLDCPNCVAGACERHQPLPLSVDGPAIADLVAADLFVRKEHGIRTYGRALQAHNGRNGLQDLYEELLDACCYVRQLLEEEKIGETQ